MKTITDLLDGIRGSMPPGSTLTYQLAGDTLRLDILRVRHTRRRAGSLALQRIVDVADAHGLTITGVADPTDEPGDPDTTTLLRWYRQFGFEVVGCDPDTGSPAIERRPVKPALAPDPEQALRQTFHFSSRKFPL